MKLFGPTTKEIVRGDIWPRIFKGITRENKTFCGPHTVQIDLTDICNNSCIACWVHSPLLDEREIFPGGKKELPFDLVEQLLSHLNKMGTREIILSGSGEPFMYPKIKRVIELIKGYGMYLNIITNATLINKETAEFIVDHKVDLITASVWAGSPEAYVSTHPDRSAKDFDILKRNLKYLSCYKDETGLSLPHTKIYNVLCNKNYKDIEHMMDFARDVDADFIEFQIVDIMKGKTDSLLLDGNMREEVSRSFDRLIKKNELIKWQYVDLENYDRYKIEDFGKLWKNSRPDFFILERGHNIICPEGNLCVKGEGTKILLPPGHYQQLNFKFFFDRDQCDKCQRLKQCFPEKDYALNVKLLNFLGVETFFRRIRSAKAEEGFYEDRVVAFPCYIGWYYARILTSGDVIPCCKAYLHPLGNILKNPFSKIWNSEAYREFRTKAKKTSKKDPYFQKINCVKSCDNWGMNEEIHNRFISFGNANKGSGARKSIKEIVINANDYIHGNLNPGKHDFGANLLIDGGKGSGFAYYTFTIYEDGVYDIWSRYASNELRPVDIAINRDTVKKGGLGSVTGGWTPDFLKWFKEFTIELKKGDYLFEIRSGNPIPHIEKFVLFKTGNTPAFISREQNPPYLKMIYDRIRKRGVSDFLNKVRHYLSPRHLRDRYIEALGIYDGGHGYKGPFHVQIDLTNNCNNNCIACWCNSPLLKETKLSEEQKKQYLPVALVKELLDEAVRGGATEIYYSGSGEPFTHPNIMEILEYSKKKNLICHVNTNFTVMDKEKLGTLIKIGLDFLTVSTWSATPETYARTHPNKSREDFCRIRENLIYLNTKKKDKPYIKLYNVLFNMNYSEVEKMVDFAAETKSESLEFTLVDTIPNATDALVLDEKQTEELKKSLNRIKSRLNKQNRARNTNVLIFQFDQFLRRVCDAEDVQDAKYDRNIIDSMPCYIGWLFARVIPNGEVHSCLKAHRIPTGSLYDKRFLEIWNSDRQGYFRKKTKVYKKDDPFFRSIGNDCNIKEAGCYKSCDDIGRNTWMHSRMQILSLPEQLVINGIAKSLKFARKIKAGKKKPHHKDYHADPLMAGILHGRKAFRGPEQVVIDPTNRCNLKCVSCWLYSPMLTKDKPSSDWLKKEFPSRAIFGLIDDLADMRTKRIRFTGGGEPFMHRDLMAMIEYARQKGLQVGITTNFGLVSKEDIKKLLALGIEELCISIWASNPDFYKKIHPQVPAEYFEKLKGNLALLKGLKKDKPRVTFANVLMNSNISDFTDMYDFAVDYGADAVYYTLVDVFKDQTDSLLLREGDRKELLCKAYELQKRNKKDRIELEFFNGFLRRVSKTDEDFKKGEYDKNDIDRIPCYVGWIFTRILADGSVVPCCRGVKKVMGNINEKSFKDIWYSEIYDEFRGKAKYLHKDDGYFRGIGCVKECDNLMHNEAMHGRVCRDMICKKA
ncbi:MAG: radical SAM protein [Candidatus Omnitrophica bacterium]|nr:radical SAM protein [Candidatus Omnitrophota bacterium]